MDVPARLTGVGRSKQLCWHTMHVGLASVSLATSVPALLRTLAAGAGAWQLAARLAWVLTGTWLLAIGLALGSCAYLRKLSHAATVDWSLVFLATVPAIQAAARVNDTSMQSTCWAAHFAFVHVLGGIMDFTPMHTMLQLLVLAPSMCLLELYDVYITWATCMGDPQAQADGACSNSSQPALSALASLHQEGHLTRYLLTRLPVSLAGLCASAVIPAILFLIHNKRLHGSAAVHDDPVSSGGGKPRPSFDSCPPPPLPLESLGLHLVSGLGLRGPLLRMELWLERAASACSEGLLVRLACVPIAVYYLGLAITGRQNIAVRQVAMDEWILAMGVWFMLGRESCKLDVLPFLAQARARVQVSQAVLTDLLPAHIVRVLLSSHSSHAHGGGATAAAAAAGGGAGRDDADGSGSGSDCGAADEEADLSALVEAAAGAEPASAVPSAPIMTPSAVKVSPPEHAKDEAGGKVLEIRVSPPWGRSAAGDAVAPAALLPPQQQAQGGTSDASDAASLASSGASSRPRASKIEEYGCPPPADRQAPTLACMLHAVLPALKTTLSSLPSPGPPLTGGSSVRSSPAGGSPPAAAAVTSFARRSSKRDPSQSHLDPAGSNRPSLSGNQTLDPLHKLKLAEAHDCVTVFFSDICGFSSWAHKLSPDKVMDTLNDLYCNLDTILMAEMPNLYKIETIGDAYMVVSNLSAQDPGHAADMVRFALRAQLEAARVLRPDRDDGTTLQLRIGLHSGPAVSGIVGKLRRRFCMFGDTVNIASRTETTCPSGSIQISAVTHGLAAPRLAAHEALFVDRGEVELKGAERPMRMYLVQPGTDSTGAST